LWLKLEVQAASKSASRVTDALLSCGGQRWESERKQEYSSRHAENYPKNDQNGMHMSVQQVKSRDAHGRTFVRRPPSADAPQTRPQLEPPVKIDLPL
jgi:hypothetical protein